MANSAQLSAIIFSDIEGYTALMQNDERSTLQLLNKYELTLAETVRKHGGEIVKNYGDGSICLFPSAVSSVACAMELQQLMKQHPIVPLRIGVNLGDVHRKGDDVYGDAINITSRIESMGIAGNILVSHSLYDKVKNQPEFQFQTLGKFDFKNVSGAIEVFAIANEGFVVPKQKELAGKFTKKGIRRKNFLLISLIAILTVLYLVQNNMRSDTGVNTPEVGNKIAVLDFDNYTGDQEYDIAGKMAVDWIIHGITANEMGQVISPKIIEDYSKVLTSSEVRTSNSTVLTDYLKPSKIISGSIYLDKDRLLFQCSITDETMNKTLISIDPVQCDPKAPLDCIEAVKQRILGYLITEDHKALNLQETPPNYEAYQFLMQAKLVQYKNDEEHLRLLDKAIAADTTYFEPKTYKLVHYYNNLEYAVADSLLKKYFSASKANERQRNLFNLYKALLEGDNRNAYLYSQKEYNITPLDMETNSSMMTVALQFVNRPLVVDSFYSEIEMKDMDLQNCAYCEDRYYIEALAHLELKKYEEAMALLRSFEKEKDYYKLKKVLIRAHIKAGDYSGADTLLSNVQITSDEQDWMEVYLFIARDLLLNDQRNKGFEYLNNIINTIGKSPKSQETEFQKLLAESLFLKEDYQTAQLILEKLVLSVPDLISHNALLAICYQKNGEPEKARMQLEALEKLRGNHQFGSVDYAMAQYYSSVGDDENVIKYLIKAVASGRWYDPVSFQNDPFFKKYITMQSFEQIMNFWH